MTNLPDDLADRYAAWSFAPVGTPPAGRAAYRLDGIEETRYVVIVPAAVERELADEAVRLRWAGQWLPVPAMVEHGSDGERAWLMTEALPGVPASAHPWRRADPGRLAETLGAALRRWHDQVPVRECPFDASADALLARAEAQVAAARPGDGGPGAVLDQLRASVPPPGREVVCLGGFRLDGVLLTGADVTGLAGVGGLGVADPWWDVATAIGDLDRHCGTGHADAFLSGYRAAPDPARATWYVLLDALL